MSLPKREELTAAIGRLSGTRDGAMLRRYCQLEVNRIATQQEIACGALHFSEGRRSFAREIASLLDAPDAKAQTLDHRSTDPDEPVVNGEPAKPVSGRDPLRRRVPADPDWYRKA